MKLGNIEVDFSFSNTTNLRKLENAYNKLLLETETKKTQAQNFIDEIDIACNIVRNFLNEVFGKGMDKKILGEENDFEKATDILEDIMKQYQEEQNRLSGKYAKYNPERVKKGKKK